MTTECVDKIRNATKILSCNFFIGARFLSEKFFFFFTSLSINIVGNFLLYPHSPSCLIYLYYYFYVHMTCVINFLNFIIIYNILEVLLCMSRIIITRNTRNGSTILIRYSRFARYYQNNTSYDYIGT